MIRLVYFIPIWLVFLLFRTLVIALGLIIIPPLAIMYKLTTKTEISIINGREILNWKYKLFWLWSNQEDGILAGEELLKYPNAIRIIYWSAIRNPANNLRFIQLLSVKIEPKKINFILSKLKTFNDNYGDKFIHNYDSDLYRFTTLTWQGIYSNLRIQFKMFNKIWRFWIGWKIYPHDILGIDPNDYRAKSAGFATQFKRIYPR
ncbi:MAG: DUF7338 family protein [Anaerotignaceae bacterium]